mgnify:CR=1 FL=1
MIGVDPIGVGQFVARLPLATINLWKWTRSKMLPSPAKFHYIFNMRELSRIFQGVLRTPLAQIPDEKVLVQLWRHECDRVIQDKLTTLEDKAAFAAELNDGTRITSKKGLLSPHSDEFGTFGDFGLAPATPATPSPSSSRTMASSSPSTTAPPCPAWS